MLGKRNLTVLLLFLLDSEYSQVLFMLFLFKQGR